MRFAKRVFTLILAMIMLALTACGASGDSNTTTAAPTEATPNEITLDKSYVIVVAKDADDTATQAANLLQVTADWKMNLDLEIVNEDPGTNAIVLCVDSTMPQEQYGFTIKGTSLHITAGESHVLMYAVKQLRLTLLGSEDPKLVTVSTCQTLSGSVDMSNLPITLVSQNILFKNIEGGNTVKEREPRFEDLLHEYQPDILTLQENSTDWTYFCKSKFRKTYTMVDDYGCSVLYRKDRFEVVKEGHFYMSPTPEIKSQFEGDSGPRFCCWVVLKDNITGKEFFISNAHLDWNNDTQRALQLEVMLEQTSTYREEYPSIAVGDFNSQPDGPIYARATEFFIHAKDSAKQNLSTVDFTSHNFGQKSNFIDYIFHTPEFQVNLYYILSDHYGGYVSDHYGVMVELQFAE